MEKDTQIYVDRADYAPGLFEDPDWQVPYKWKCSEHPRVSCELTVPTSDTLGVSYYDRGKYGGGRFFGTLWPYKRMVNPLMVGTVTSIYDNVGMVPSSRSEFSGSSVNQEVEFRIMWRQIDGQAPTKIQVFINNANTRTKVAGTSADVVGGVPTDQNADYTYKSYTMVPDDSNGDFASGVWFRFRTKDLKPGPHTYYFEASDTEQTCIWPRRPDRYVYPPDGTWYMDYWVPTQSAMPKSQADLATYDDNDYCPGPYVNSVPVLSDYSVTPTTGKMGQTFTYRVKYTDADGESPYSAYVWIQTADGAAFQKFAMTPEITINPTADNRALFVNGVYYKFDTGTLQGIALYPGTRRYYFEFTDNWGRAVDVNDRISGDTVNVTNDGRKEKDGPTIDGPQPPTLTQGKVESADGTKNSATMWKFSVKYSDLNNDPPQALKVYIGQLQPDGKTVLWDAGNTMSPEDPADKVYTDGAIYYYMTRLEGQKVTRLVNGFSDDRPKRYFYAFLAYDGSAWATWTPAVDPVNNPPSPYYRPSDSASMYVFQALTGSDGTYTMPIPSTLSSKDIVPIVGPILTDLPVPRGELSDAQLYTSPDTPSAPDGLPVLTNSYSMMADDQKSGWTDEPRYSMMKGNATDVDGKPSDVYVVPASPNLLASIDGVYTSIEGMLAATTGDNPEGADTTNYYDGSALTETVHGVVDPMQQDGTVVLVDWNGYGVPNHDNDWRIGQIVSVTLGNGKALTVAPGNRLNEKGQIIIDTTVTKPKAGQPVVITYKRAGYTPGNPEIWLTTPLPADNVGKTVFIKYNDIRFTHRVRGATQINNNGFTSLYLDGAFSGAVAIKTSTVADPYSGFIGVWNDLDRTWPNYFNPSLDFGNYGGGPVTLTTNTPDGLWEAYAYYYQYGDYNIDRFSRTIRYTDKYQDAGTPVYATYMWGLPMEDADGVVWIGQNTSPHLKNGKVTPKNGARNTTYVYSVDYQDLDGPNGQAPEYVRVYIDGVPYNMAPTGGGGTPPYKDGVTYTYSASPMSAQSHSYHFDASDGDSVVWLDYDKVSRQEVEHRYNEKDWYKTTLTTQSATSTGLRSMTHRNLPMAPPPPTPPLRVL